MKKETGEWMGRLGGRLTRHGTDRASSTAEASASPDARAPDEDPTKGTEDDGADTAHDAVDKSIDEAASKGAYEDGSAGELGKALNERFGKYADATADVEAIAAKARAVPWRQLPHMAWLGLCSAAAIVAGFYGVGWATNHPTSTPLSIAERTSRVFEQRQKTQQELARQQAALQVMENAMGSSGSGPAPVAGVPDLGDTQVLLTTPTTPPVMVPARILVAAMPASMQPRAAQAILTARVQQQPVRATVVVHGSGRDRGDSGGGRDRGGLDLPGGFTISNGGGTISFNH